jgi:hypothetical protein
MGSVEAKLESLRVALSVCHRMFVHILMRIILNVCSWEREIWEIKRGDQSDDVDGSLKRTYFT